MPRYLCNNEDGDVQFDIMEDGCSAMEEKDRYEEGLRGGSANYKAPAGQVLRPKPYLVSGGDPASVRDAYYQSEYEKRLQLAEDEAGE